MIYMGNFLWIHQKKFLQEYSRLESEAASVIPGHRPAKSWPSVGRIDYVGVCASYRPDLPMVLKGATFSIMGGEKVGRGII